MLSYGVAYVDDFLPCVVLCCAFGVSGVSGGGGDAVDVLSGRG
jgi:hypothetical protein